MSVTAEEFRKAELNEDYAVREFNSLRQSHPDTYVGVLDGQPKYFDQDLDALLSKIRTDRGGSTRGVLVLFLPSKQATIVV